MRGRLVGTRAERQLLALTFLCHPHAFSSNLGAILQPTNIGEMPMVSCPEPSPSVDFNSFSEVFNKRGGGRESRMKFRIDTGADMTIRREEGWRERAKGLLLCVDVRA